jgi:hypothetical protein
MRSQEAFKYPLFFLYSLRANFSFFLTAESAKIAGDKFIKNKKLCALCVLCGKITFLTLTSILFFSGAYAQTSGLSFGPWRQLSLSGKIGLEALRRTQETTLKSNISEQLKTSLLSGRLLLQSRSYIWHPNFMLLDIDLNYSPATRRDEYLQIPDHSEVRTLESGSFQSTFFKDRPIVLKAFANLSHHYVNREYLTNVETYNNNFGGILSFRNKFLPITMNYQQGKWQQKELQTGRLFEDRNSKFQARLTKSFSHLDDHQVSYSYTDYTRYYTGLLQVHHITDIDLRNKIFFDTKQTGSLQSLIQYYDQKGSNAFNRFQIYETANLRLPHNLRFSGNYQYLNFEQRAARFNQHNIIGRLEHQLYLSLKTQLYYEYSFMNQFPLSKELMNTGGILFQYRKKVPTGFITLHYEYRRRHQNRSSPPVVLQIIHEAQQLTDDQPVLLNHPFVTRNNVIITNAEGTIIYQENIDYVLIERGDFLEVQRLSGGQIANGATVYIDYQTSQQGSYKFDTNNYSWGASITLFQRFIELYYRAFDQDFDNVHLIDHRILKYISQYVLGGRLSYGFFTGGVEIDNFDSNIVPYHLKRYFINLTGSTRNRLILSLIANLRDYLLTGTNERQLFSDISAKMTYNLWREAKINLETGYRHQDGREIELDLFTMRGELYTQYRQLLLTLGFELFRREFLTEKIDFNGLFMRVERQF